MNPFAVLNLGLLEGDAFSILNIWKEGRAIKRLSLAPCHPHPNQLFAGVCVFTPESAVRTTW